jgi:hypothetical protein
LETLAIAKDSQIGLDAIEAESVEKPLIFQDKRGFQKSI